MDGFVSTDGHQSSTWPRYKMIDDLEGFLFYKEAIFIVQNAYFTLLLYFHGQFCVPHNVTKCLRAL